MLKNNLATVQAIYQYYLQYPHICTDTRSIVGDSLFFSLRGTSHNGNHFAAAALQGGCAYAVVDDPTYYEPGGRYLLVADTLHTLQALAQCHRRTLSIPIVAITGSNGKTTTKELLATILKQRYQCYATKGNLNNHIGVPLSILAIKPDTEIAVLEMGANHLGEIAHLCEIAQPTHGLITHIGPAHLAGFGDIQGVARGKGELYAYLQKTGGVIFVNSTDSTLMELIKASNSHVVCYPQPGDFYQATLVEANPYLQYKSESGGVVTTHLVGKHHFNNVAAAACIATYLGVDHRTIDAAIQSYVPTNNRSQIVHTGSNIILLDAYNANPASMRAALEAFAALPAPYKVAILGNMNELGAASVAFHNEIVSLTTQYDYQEVLLCGPDMALAAPCNPRALHFKDKEALAVYLQTRSFSHAAILLKGSHSYSLESLVACIKTG